MPLTHACMHAHTLTQLQCTLQPQANLVTVHFITAGVKGTVCQKKTSSLGFNQAGKSLNNYQFSKLETFNQTEHNLIQI